MNNILINQTIIKKVKNNKLKVRIFINFFYQIITTIMLINLIKSKILIQIILIIKCQIKLNKIKLYKKILYHQKMLKTLDHF